MLRKQRVWFVFWVHCLVVFFVEDFHCLNSARFLLSLLYISDCDSATAIPNGGALGHESRWSGGLALCLGLLQGLSFWILRMFCLTLRLYDS